MHGLAEISEIRPGKFGQNARIVRIITIVPHAPTVVDERHTRREGSADVIYLRPYFCLILTLIGFGRAESRVGSGASLAGLTAVRPEEVL